MDIPSPAVRYFGRRWNAPAFDDAVRVPVPFGATCLYCSELVDDTDSGLMQVVVFAAGPRDEAVHIECHLRSILGSVAHLEHRCSCFGGEDHEVLTREGARAVVRWLIDDQTCKGLPHPGFVD